MIRSMTGYGRAVFEEEDSWRAVVEISSVNRKNLDIAVSMPREWQKLEAGVTDVIRKRIGRGRINVSVAVESGSEGEAVFFNAAEVEKVLRELEDLSKKLQVPFAPDSKLLFQLAASVRGKASLPEAEAVGAGVMEAVEKAATEMVGMRSKEGEALRADLSERNQGVRAHLASIREAAGGVVPNYRETLLKRLRQSGLDFTLDDERVLREIAIFADRADVSEELTRLESHLSQFDEILDSTEPVGRKLEFLLQEIGREFNTIGSKASDGTISRLVIECKNELERVREQVLNVE